MNMNLHNKAIERIIDFKPELKPNKKSRRLLSVGKRIDNKEYFPVTNEINRIRSFDNELCTLEKYQDKSIEISNMDNGDPCDSEYFPLVDKYIKKCFKKKAIYQYPAVVGADEYREDVLKYLYSEGFSKNTELNNIAFTVSTSQAFRLIVKIIARPYDVILFTAPNYGLFTFIAENTGAVVETVDLDKEDSWYANSNKIAKRIDEINKDLKKKYKDLDYTPRVVGFFFENPNNPTGKVLGKKQSKILKGILDECVKRNVFIIDDLVYKDISYDMNNQALPLATFHKNEDMIISLYGVSKSYGLAGLRAGFVVANEIIIQGIKDLMFQELDSVPIVQSAVIAACYNDTKERNKVYKKYFNKLIKRYKFHLELVNAMINGIDCVKDSKTRKKICNSIKKYCKEDYEVLIKGFEDINIVEDMIPESGFFLVTDFTKLIGKKYKNKQLNNMMDISRLLYKDQSIRLLIGEAMSWPDKNSAVGRFSFAFNEEKLIKTFQRLHYFVKELK